METTFRIFNTSSANELGKSIAGMMKAELGKLHTEKFSDGEIFVRFDESVRGHTVFLIARVNMPYEHLFELYLAIDAAKRASAREIICVTPYIPHSRQERRNGERVSVASRLVADFIQQAGADRIITMDLHAESIEGFYSIPVDHLDASYFFVPHIQKLAIPALCVCSPDFGALKRVKKYKKMLGCDIAVINKERLLPNQVASMEIIGNVQGKNVILIDDMIDTAGTLCKAAELIMSEGAKSVMAYATHGLFTGNAIEKIQNSALSAVYVSDSINGKFNSEKIKVITCAELLSVAMERLFSNKSLREIYPK
jgi:ribose-phosphate pyrophosphokinase